MPSTLKRIYTGQPGTTDTLLYTVPGATKVAITDIHLANTDATPRGITIGLNAGGALAEASYFIPDLEVPANGVADWTGHQVLEAGETIRALQDNATGVTVHISGVEVS